jgi:hypothetical protein
MLTTVIDLIAGMARLSDFGIMLFFLSPQPLITQIGLILATFFDTLQPKL